MSIAWIGPHTVNTMPGKTIQAFLNHGTVKRTVDSDLEDAKNVILDLEAAGISIYKDHRPTRDRGIESFEYSFKTLRRCRGMGVAVVVPLCGGE